MMVTTRGSIGVAARRDVVWAALHDAERIALCVPGCRKVMREGDDVYAVEASVRLGPVRVAFDGVVEVSDFEAPARLALIGRGRGGLAGAASGTATIRLSDRPDGCRLAYELKAKTDGPMTQLGSLFLTGLAAALSDMFAHRFARLFEPQPPRQTSRWRSKALSRPTTS